jgi:nitrite reductase/ring-hydroxylating ferredoxin subunit
MLTTYTRVAGTGDLKDGSMLNVSAEGEAICLARLGDKYYAINNVCTHFFTYLTDGELYPDTCEVQCPLHDSRFNLETGEASEPPADVPEEVYNVKIEGDDILVGPKE